MFESPSSAVQIAVSPTVTLDADLIVPAAPIGWVLFANGSGSSRAGTRNRHLARRLHRARIATLLTGLLTAREEEDEARRFDIDLLTERLRTLTQWLRHQEFAQRLPLGYFGASTGTAAALRVHAHDDAGVAAIVSRGGRPDLAGADVLASVHAPTLLIIGGHDADILDLNRKAYAQLTGAKRLHIVQGATHLFEEAGTLDEVAHEAQAWFTQHFVH